MTRTQPPVNKFFVSSDYSIYLRQANALAWQNPVTSNYALLTMLDGQLECFRNQESTSLGVSQSLTGDHFAEQLYRAEFRWRY